MSADQTPLRQTPELENDWGDWAMPIDFGILKSLPKQGSRLGYHPLGATVKVIRQRLNDELPEDVPLEARLGAGVIAQRIARWLVPKGMVIEVRVHGSGGAKGYQVTERGLRMRTALEKEMG